MKQLIAYLKFDLSVHWRGFGTMAYSMSFFLLGTLIFSVFLQETGQPQPYLTGTIIWVIAIFAAVLPLENLFRDDVQDGTLDQLKIAGFGEESIFLSKALLYWLQTGLPFLLIVPVITYFAGFSYDMALTLWLTFLIGTPILCLIGTTMGCLVIGAARSGILLSLLVVPLMVPVLAFSLSAIEAIRWGGDSGPHLSLLVAYLCFCIFLSLILSRQAVKNLYDV